MSLEIVGIQSGGVLPDHGKSDGVRIPVLQHRDSPQIDRSQTDSEQPAPEELLKGLADIPDALQRRLKFSIRKELDMVVVKVIDAETDKIIKEIPPEELQSLHIRIREALGLLIDEKV